MSHNWPLSVLLVLLLAASLAYDLAQRRIPNWLVLAGLIAGVGCHLLSSAGHWANGIGLGESLLGILAGFSILLPLYLLRAMGGGDVKLMAAIGAFLGPTQVAGAALLTFIAGGLLSLGAAIWSRSLPRVLGNLRLIGMVAMSDRASGLSVRDVQTTGRLPYAIAIAIGTTLQIWLANLGGWPFT